MSSADTERAGGERHGAVDTVAGFLAAFSLALSVVVLAERPARLGPAAMLLALLAARMSARRQTLSLIAVVVAMVCFTAGMAFAVLTDTDLY